MSENPSPSPELTSAEKKELLLELNSFLKWLKEKKIIDKVRKISLTVDFPFSDADWMMRYDAEKGAVAFNTFTKKDCSSDYYKSIILHEFFHLAVQRVPNKEDAVKIKDDFGDELMRLIDIEADFFTALYFKEVRGFTMVQYLKLYYEGSKVFRDKWIRIGKLQRFIGTLLSISKMFLENIDKKVVTSYDLYLVCIGPLSTEDGLHVLVIRKEHIYFELIEASTVDFVKIRECYSDIDSLTLRGYVEKISNFVSKALKTPLPDSVKQEIKKL